VLRRRLAYQAKKNRVSLNAEMEARLQDSFDLATTASLIRVLSGGEFAAELLGAIAKVFDLGSSEWKRWPEKSEANQVQVEAVYIALILIFTELFSTPERPLDPAAARKPIAALRPDWFPQMEGDGSLSLPQVEALLLASTVLKKAKHEHISLLEPAKLQRKHGPTPASADFLSERGLLPKKKKPDTLKPKDRADG
jgi:hypothetical protein